MPEQHTPSWAQPQGPSDTPPAAPDTEPNATKSKDDKKNTCLGCGCLGVVAVALIFAVAASCGSSTTASSPAPAPSHTTATPSSRASAPATADSTPSPSPTSSSLGAAAGISAWWTGGGQDRASAMQKDLTAIGTDGQNQDVAQMSIDCQSLSADVTSAQAYGPIPDTEAQHHWATALADYSQAASDCKAGTTAQDVAQITQAAGEINSGNEELNKVTARIKAIDSSL